MSPEEMRKEVDFWREQYKLAADVAKVLADLNDHDGRVAELERLLRQEIARREAAEREAARLAELVQRAEEHTEVCQ